MAFGYCNSKPIQEPYYPTSVRVWCMTVYDFHMQVESLTAVRIDNRFASIKKEHWRSAWKTAKALYYFYQNEAKPYTEKNQPELAGAIQDVFEELNECLLDLKVLYRHASRNKLWAEN